MFQLVAAKPKLHRAAVEPALSNFDGRRIAIRDEVTAMINVTAEAVHEVQAIAFHYPHPESQEYHLSTVETIRCCSTQENRPISGLGTGDMPRYQARQSRRRPVGAASLSAHPGRSKR